VNNKCTIGNAAITTTLVLFTVVSSAAARERSVYLYGIEKISRSDWDRQIAKWQAEGVQRAIVSLEAGSRSLLENQAVSDRLTDYFTGAVLKGIRIEGLILQDPSWALKPSAACKRLDLVIEFARLHPGLIDQVQIDVEVYTAPAMFANYDPWARFGDLATALRSDIDRSHSAVQLDAASPWWLAHKLTENQLRIVTKAFHTLSLMVYGEPGGTAVAADLKTFSTKVIPALEKLVATGTSFRVGVAKYEHPSAQALTEFATTLDQFLAGTPGFEGITYFHEASVYKSAAGLAR
jgi:hypothetical protein